MKYRMFTLALILGAAFVQSACLTIDEERFSDVACADLKNLLAQDNLRALASTTDFKFNNLRDADRKDKQIFASPDSGEKQSLELRAAYKNMCQ
jgi:hypothetical protein